MKNYQKGTKWEIAKRFLAAVLVVAAVVWVSGLAMHSPAHNPNSMVRSLKSIQTDEAIQFQANIAPGYATRFVERVPAMTGESKALTGNLKLIAATL